MRQIMLLVISLLALSGCVSKVEKPGDPYYAPVSAQKLEAIKPVTGSLYSAAHSRDIYSNGRASRVGDIITIVLEESTQSSKSTSTSLEKTSETTLPQATVFGRGVALAGNPVSASTGEATTEFDGSGSSDMSNSLSGNITVTVHDVLPNGTMVVRGEKWLTLNQGEEYIRVSGLVRPQDVDGSNSVVSTKLADARIEYGGTGDVSNSSTPGLLTKFFVGLLLPF
ncbi:MAG: flagellar basal body L-ring protein FlgH [Pontibacterium sp.]